MTKEQFEDLLSMVDPHIKKVSQRKAVSTREMLFITLRHLATGSTQTEMSYNFRVGQPTLSKRIGEMTQVLWEVLSPVYLKPPTTEEWKNIARQFYEKWQVPNCVGAIDGKHCVMMAPENSGSEFFTHKRNFSIVLLAVVDANYNFLLVEIGAPGSYSDGGIFQNSDFGRDILNQTINIPADQPLPGQTRNFPHYFVADAAFPLRRNVMKPYPGHVLPQDKTYYNQSGI
uniref:DDE Tnp4 domain-containing protein n=1 Tax=Phlebotomus papatasi TaxID=29031 RepID=A0A1B0DMT5_PHLPP